MKIVLRGSSFLAALLGGKRNGPGSGKAPVLKLGSAGNVRVGMPASDVKASGRDLSFEIEGGVVHAIRVHSRRYKTEAGIGIGDSAIALANHYPIRWTEDIAEVDDLNMKFQIREDRIVSILIS